MRRYRGGGKGMVAVTEFEYDGNRILKDKNEPKGKNAPKGKIAPVAMLSALFSKDGKMIQHYCF